MISPSAQSEATDRPGLLVLSAAERAACVERDRELWRLIGADPQAALAAAEAWLAGTQLGGELEAWALRARANALRGVGRYAEALVGFEHAERRFDQLDLGSEAARTGRGHVWTLRLLGRYDEAVRLGLRTRRFLRDHGETLEAALITLNLGAVYRRLGRLQAARRAYLEAARDSRRCGNPTGEATALSNLGNVLADLGRYDESERAQRRAIRLYSQLQQPAEVARARLNLGLLMKRRGDYGRALVSLQESRALYVSLGLTDGVALVDLDLAQTYLALNLRQEAASACERARSSFEQLDMPYELGQAMLWSAALCESGDRDLAANLLTKSAKLFRRTGNRLWEAVASVLAASLSEADETALQVVAVAEQRLARLGARDHAAEARLVQGNLLRHLGRRDRALSRYRAAARLAGETGDDSLGFRARAALGQMLEESSPRRALNHYQAAMDQLEALRRRARADDLKLSFMTDKLDVFERSVGLLLRPPTDQRRAAEAFDVVERGKSLGLLDELVARSEGSEREPAALAQRLRNLRARLGEAHARHDDGRGPWNSDLDTTVANLEQEVAVARRDLQLATRRDTPALKFQAGELQAALPPGGALLEFFSLGQELICFVLDSGGIRLRRGLGTLADVARIAERLRFHFGKGVYGAAYLEANLVSLRRSLDRVLGDLWQLLVPLLADVDTAGHLIIVPHGPLHGLPLHAAFNGQTYLAERWSVSYAPSARVFVACSRRTTDAPRRPLFVGPRDESLPWVAHEVAALADLFPEGEALAGRRATVAGLRRRTGQFDLLHLAAHGVFRADNPNFSALRLSDGWLTVGDLAEISRDATLVTLSACETGLNSVAAGEELVGLTRAVLGAGAASLLASLWTVHDETTSRFMAEFYQGLVAGRGKSASLQQAMWAVRRDFDHPHFWAPFALAGAL